MQIKATPPKAEKEYVDVAGLGAEKVMATEETSEKRAMRTSMSMSFLRNNMQTQIKRLQVHERFSTKLYESGGYLSVLEKVERGYCWQEQGSSTVEQVKDKEMQNYSDSPDRMTTMEELGLLGDESFENLGLNEIANEEAASNAEMASEMNDMAAKI